MVSAFHKHQRPRHDCQTCPDLISGQPLDLLFLHQPEGAISKLRRDPSGHLCPSRAFHRIAGEICAAGGRHGRAHLVDLIPDQQGAWKTKPLEFRLALPKLLVHFGRNLPDIVECLAQLRRDIGVQPRRARQALAIFGKPRFQLRHQIEHAAE